MIPLPDSAATPWHEFKYTEAQMIAYAAAARAEALEEAARLCELWNLTPSDRIAFTIRALK